ncbi:MAG: ABC transporter permease subunit [Halobacteriota archaeon]
MSVVAVAKKDFADARRSKALQGLAILFVVMGVGGTYLYTLLPTMDPELGPVSPEGLYVFLGQISALFIAISAVVLSYKAIAGESESGSVKLLLGLPHTRWDVFLGKVIGRSSVMFLALLVGLLATFGVATALLEGASAVGFAGFLVVTMVFGLVYVTLMVSISASTASTSRAATLGIGLFVVLELMWDVVVFGVAFVANGFTVPAGSPTSTWVLALSGFAPTVAYDSAVTWVVGFLAGQPPTVPFFRELWFALLVFAFWALLPALFGYSRYRRADL